jgi:hypothetical protein
MARYRVQIIRKDMDGSVAPGFPLIGMTLQIAAPNDEVAEDIAEEVLGHIHRAFGVVYGPRAPLTVDSVTGLD